MRFSIRSKLHILLSVVVILSISLAFFLSQKFTSHAASPSSQPSWNIFPSPNVASANNVLDATAAISSSDVWAVGYSTDTSGLQHTQTLTEHWNGTNWTIVPSPSVASASNFLTGVAAISSTNVWAVGYHLDDSGPLQTLTEHWDGTSWTIVPSPNPDSSLASQNFLNGVAAVSASDVWAVGYNTVSSGFETLTEHWDGTVWSVVPSPNVVSAFNFFNGVAAVSTSDVWAVGFTSTNGAGQTLTEHWDGTSWTIVPSPNPSSSANRFAGVAAVSVSDVWAVGNYSDSSGLEQTLTEHWDGTVWSVVPSPGIASANNFLNGVAAVSTSDVWAVGTFSDSSGLEQTLTEHWDGTSWSIVSSPNAGTGNNALFGVVTVSSDDVWAVGFDLDPTGISQTLIEHFGPSTVSPHQILFVLIQGIDTSLSQQDVDMNGGLGMISDFNTTAKNGVQGIVPSLKSQFPTAQFLAFSYLASNPANGDPFPYTCLDTFTHHIDHDALLLGNQITSYLNAQPQGSFTDVYLIGHSLGGTVALAYLTALLKAPDQVSPIPINKGRLAGVITLDSPVGGVSSNKGFLNFTFTLFHQQLGGLLGCMGLTNRKTQFNSVQDLATLFNTTSQPTFPKPDDGNPGSQGAHASILKAIFNGQALTNQGLVAMAAAQGIAVFTIGNLLDFLYNPSACPFAPAVTFTDAQWIGDEGSLDGALEGHPVQSIYGREFVAGQNCISSALFNLINHKEVYNNKDVETALSQFLPKGGEPKALTVAPPEP